MVGVYVFHIIYVNIISLDNIYLKCKQLLNLSGIYFFLNIKVQKINNNFIMYYNIFFLGGQDKYYDLKISFSYIYFKDSLLILVVKLTLRDLIALLIYKCLHLLSIQAGTL